MNVLITGYTGFIGCHLVKNLIDKKLSGVDIFKNDSVSKHFQWEELHLCTGQDCIIHLAGKAHDTMDTSSEQEYYNINVGLTQIIFQYFLKSTATKFIFFSSIKAVTDSVAGDQLTEDVLPNPTTPYGKSKLEAEKYILNEYEKWKEEEMKSGKDNDWKKIYILRPCMIYGTGNKGNLNLLIKLQQKGYPWPLGIFENKRSFCCIENIRFVVQQLIDNNIVPGTYNVSDDEPISTNELVILIASSLDKKAIIWRIPKGVIKLIAITGDFLGLPLNSERLKKLTENFIVSNQKLKNALGINNMPVVANEGLRITIESFHHGITKKF